MYMSSLKLKGGCFIIEFKAYMFSTRDVALLIISHEQTQIKQNLQFSFLKFGLVALDGSTFTRMFAGSLSNT